MLCMQLPAKRPDFAVLGEAEVEEVGTRSDVNCEGSPIRMNIDVRCLGLRVRSSWVEPAVHVDAREPVDTEESIGSSSSKLRKDNVKVIVVGEEGRGVLGIEKEKLRSSGKVAFFHGQRERVEVIAIGEVEAAVGIAKENIHLAAGVSEDNQTVVTELIDFLAYIPAKSRVQQSGQKQLAGLRLRHCIDQQSSCSFTVCWELCCKVLLRSGVLQAEGKWQWIDEEAAENGHPISNR